MKKVTRSKPKMGRPPYQPENRRGERFLVRFTKGERARLERAARAAGKPVATFMRDTTLAACGEQEGTKR